MTRHILGFALGLVVLLGGCKPSPEDIANGNDPIKALAASARSTRYDGPYWSAQRHDQSTTWRQAAAFCTPERVLELPNCQPVVANAAADQGNAHADSVLRAIGASAKRSVVKP